MILQMGVKAAFDTGQFNKLTKRNNLRVSGIKHKMTIEVTKEGTEGVEAPGKLYILFICYLNSTPSPYKI